MMEIFSFLLLFNIFNLTGEIMSENNGTDRIIDEVKVVEIVTEKGNIIIELYCSKAPVTVENFLKYAEDGFYDGLIFHRVVKGFVVQGGGFLPGLVHKEPTYDPIINEAANSKLSNSRGTVAMARTSDPNSATSQFFINTCDNDRLDWDKCADGYGYCVFGKVTEGMDIVDEIEKTRVKTVGQFENVPVEDIIIEEILVH